MVDCSIVVVNSIILLLYILFFTSESSQLNTDFLVVFQSEQTYHGINHGSLTVLLLFKVLSLLEFMKNLLERGKKIRN